MSRGFTQLRGAGPTPVGEEGGWRAHSSHPGGCRGRPAPLGSLGAALTGAAVGHAAPLSLSGRRRCYDDRGLQVPAETGLLSFCGRSAGLRRVRGDRRDLPQPVSGWKVSQPIRRALSSGDPATRPRRGAEGQGGGGWGHPWATSAKNVQEENGTNASRGVALPPLDLDRKE